MTLDTGPHCPGRCQLQYCTSIPNVLKNLPISVYIGAVTTVVRSYRSISKVGYLLKRAREDGV